MKKLFTFVIALLIVSTVTAKADTIITKSSDGVIKVTITEDCLTKEIRSYKNVEGVIVKDGEWTTYDCYGNVKDRAFYNNNEKAGTWEIKSEDTTIIIPYKNGKKHGLITKKDSRDRIIEVSNYRNGDKVDAYKWSDEKGLLVSLTAN